MGPSYRISVYKSFTLDFIFSFMIFLLYLLRMNHIIWIALLPLFCPYKSTTDAWKLAESLKIASVSSSVHPSTPAQTNQRLNVGANRYGGIKRIQFVDPLKQIKEGKINATWYSVDDEFFARAFKKDFSNEAFGWWADECPQMLWCKFDDAKVPAGVTFLPTQWSEDNNKYHVTKWQFLASVDSQCNQYSAWDVICEDLSGKGYSGKTKEKGCFAGKEIQEKYKCFGIQVLEGTYALGKYDSRDDFWITNINMYEKAAGYNRL